MKKLFICMLLLCFAFQTMSLLRVLVGADEMAAMVSDFFSDDDEETGSKEGNDEVGKECKILSSYSFNISIAIVLVQHVSARFFSLYSSPCIDKIVPPPDFVM